MKKKLKFWFRYLFDKDFRWQVNYEKWAAKHSCYNCGAQDWAGYEIIGGLCNSCRTCPYCGQDKEFVCECDYDEEKFL